MNVKSLSRNFRFIRIQNKLGLEQFFREPKVLEGMAYTIYAPFFEGVTWNLNEQVATLLHLKPA